MAELGYIGQPLSPSGSDPASDELISALFVNSRTSSDILIDATLCSACSQPMHLLVRIHAPIPAGVDEEDTCRVLYIFWCQSLNCEIPWSSSLRFKIFRRHWLFSGSEGDDDESAQAQQTTQLFGSAWSSSTVFSEQPGTAWSAGLFSENTDSAGETDESLEDLLQRRDAALHQRDPTAEQQPLQEAEKAAPAQEPPIGFWLEFEPETVKQESKCKGSQMKESVDKSEWTDEGYESTNVQDKFVYRFSKRVALSPQQVVRWELNGTPLLLAALPSEFCPPNCANCGASRRFEMQIMPTLPYLAKNSVATTNLQGKPIELDRLELGTLLCYTCSTNCSLDEAFENSSLISEFCLLQTESAK